MGNENPRANKPSSLSATAATFKAFEPPNPSGAKGSPVKAKNSKSYNCREDSSIKKAPKSCDYGKDSSSEKAPKFCGNEGT
jgi:hypothetical protein